jgi:hypothetical protein
MASATKYQMFTLLGNEFTFDVDVSKLGCVVISFHLMLHESAPFGISR